MRNCKLTRERGRARTRQCKTGRSSPVFSGNLVLRHVQKLRRSRRSVSCACASFASNRPMKILRLFRHKKLLAATARRASAASAGMDFGDIPEPNMKLSRALLIVLLLHVVAVSGIIAFNAIKTRESSFVPTVPVGTENKLPNAAPSQSGGAKLPDAVARKESAPRSDAKQSHSPSKDEHAKAPSFASATAGKPPRSGKNFIVKKRHNTA